MDLATAVICQFLPKWVNHLRPHVGQTSARILTKKPKWRGCWWKEEKEKNSVYMLEFSWKILGAQVVRDSLASTAGAEGKWLGPSTAQRAEAAYS